MYCEQLFHVHKIRISYLLFDEVVPGFQNDPEFGCHGIFLLSLQWLRGQFYQLSPQDAETENQKDLFYKTKIPKMFHFNCI